VFSAVVEELSRCLVVTHSALIRYVPDGSTVMLAGLDEPGLTKPPVVRRLSGNLRICTRGRSADHCRWPPVGAAMVGSSRPELAPDTQARAAVFADLAAAAIVNAEIRRELTASRARIVVAADDARRRFERDLMTAPKNGSPRWGPELHNAEASLPPEPHQIKKQVSAIATDLAGVLEDLCGISRGIHPAILSKGGLGPALKILARRSAVPVQLDLTVNRRLAQCAEVAAYYVVADALTNTARHAQAHEVNVSVRADGANLHLWIRDDGIGGAASHKGSGLTGLTERVEALGGTIAIASRNGSGTTLFVKIPILH
jgi:signal transduction histidine kinase